MSLALSTAHPALDARLPELRSLRFGRAQPPVKRGYRPAPEGLDALFEGYDRAALPPPPVAEPPPLPVVERLPTEAGVITLPAAAPFISSKEEVDEAPSKKAKPRAATPSAPAQVMAALGARLAKGEDARSEAAKMAVDGLPADAPMEPAVCAGVEPGDDWLDFDALVLDDPADRAHRGRLTRGARPQGELDAREAARVIEELEAPAFARDPPAVRGRFDHRYDARGTVDVPASARPHRVTVGVAEGSATPRFIAVPREAAEVYREAEIKNPFDAPLLAGPVDVFLDGALMTTSELGLVDKGGVLHIGLGVEDRLRVARNARVEESTIGLLGGSLQVDHTVTVDLASSLGREVKVKVLERVPVTDDKDVEVKLLYARPEAEPYTQAERGAPVRRGLAFSVDVPAGEKAKLELSYRVTLPAKNEIVGGNRRD